MSRSLGILGLLIAISVPQWAESSSAQNFHLMSVQSANRDQRHCGKLLKFWGSLSSISPKWTYSLIQKRKQKLAKRRLHIVSHMLLRGQFNDFLDPAYWPEGQQGRWKDSFLYILRDIFSSFERNFAITKLMELPPSYWLAAIPALEEMAPSLRPDEARLLGELFEEFARREWEDQILFAVYEDVSAVFYSYVLEEPKED